MEAKRLYALWVLFLLALGNSAIWFLAALTLALLKPGPDRALLEPVFGVLIWLAPLAALVGAFLPIGLKWRFMIVGAPYLIFGATLLLSELV